MSLEGAAEILSASCEAAESARKAILVEMRETGKLLGLRLFTEATDALIADVRRSADRASADDLAEDIPAMLRRFQDGALAITAVHAAVNGDRPANEAGFEHWTAARGAYAEHVLWFVDGVLREMAKEIGDLEVAKALGANLADVVMAFVFPGFGEAPKDEVWRQERAVRFDEIRRDVRQRRAGPTA